MTKCSDDCKIPTVTLLGNHICPICQKNIHGSCGIENPGENRMKYRTSHTSCVVQQQNDICTEVSQEDSETGSSAKKSMKKRKKRDQGDAANKQQKVDLATLQSHFLNTNNKFIGLGGKEHRHYAWICRYCQAHCDKESAKRLLANGKGKKLPSRLTSPNSYVEARTHMWIQK